MADIDEDAPVTSLHNQPNDDNDPSDETQDFRFIASLTAKSGTQIPKRGEKDFEPHGTKHQDGVLAASRQAMHDVLDYTRSHVPKNYVRGFYYGGEDDWERDVAIRRETRKGLEDDHVVAVESPRGPHFKVAGKTQLGIKNARLWLLPEEALYLVERGNLDMWWPSRTANNSFLDQEVTEDGTEGRGDDSTDLEQEEKDEGTPMSLQAAYAMLLGDDEEIGRVSLERYTVYANLKRAGYVVLRAPESDSKKIGNQKAPGESSTSIFTWLFGSIFAKTQSEIPPYGPLVKPGMYRSYNSIYQQIAIIPRHKPLAVLDDSSSAEYPFRVVFQLWKPSRISKFAKSNPGEPDFRVAVIDARSTSVPSLSQATSLLESTPWDPPNEEMKGPTQTYQRLRHGYRNVVLAIIDQGIISYLRMGETAFGEEKLYERFDRGSGQGSKRGGGPSRGRGGRGRGRGRGRS